MAKNRPGVFRETIRTVDPLKDNSERVLRTISASLASTVTGVLELGVGTADEDVVYGV